MACAFRTTPARQFPASPPTPPPSCSPSSTLHEKHAAPKPRQPKPRHQISTPDIRHAGHIERARKGAGAYDITFPRSISAALLRAGRRPWRATCPGKCRKSPGLNTGPRVRGHRRTRPGGRVRATTAGERWTSRRSGACGSPASGCAPSRKASVRSWHTGAPAPHCSRAASGFAHHVDHSSPRRRRAHPDSRPGAARAPGRDPIAETITDRARPAPRTSPAVRPPWHVSPMVWGRGGRVSRAPLAPVRGPCGSRHKYLAHVRQPICQAGGDQFDCEASPSSRYVPFGRASA